MARGLRRVVTVASCALIACALGGRARAQTLYTVKDLGSLGGSVSGALSINSSLQIVGHSFLPGDVALRAVLDDGGGLRDLGTLGGPQSQARHINDAGDVVGWADAPDGGYHAFRWRAGVMEDLGTLGGTVSDARWINSHGDVVGSSLGVGDTVERAFLWRDGVMTDLGTLGGTDARAYCINGLGDIVGFARIPANDELHAFLWRHGSMTDLGTLGGWASHAYSINEAGKVCGWSMKVPNYVSHAFLWSEGVTIDLGTLGGVYSAAFALNARGDVVGTSTDASGTQHAFLWDGAKLIDLNTVIPRGTGWLLTSASSIDDAGDIVGVGRHGTLTRAFLLQPTGGLAVGPGADALAFSGPIPNPARGSAVFRLALPAAGPARVAVFDLAGRRVRTLTDGHLDAGSTRLVWDGHSEDGTTAGAGVYFARFDGVGATLTRRFVLTH